MKKPKLIPKSLKVKSFIAELEPYRMFKENQEKGGRPQSFTCHQEYTGPCIMCQPTDGEILCLPSHDGIWGCG